MKAPPLPWCAVCRRPVAELRSWYDELRREEVFEAHCHGESERVALTDAQLVLCDVRVGVAFSRAALPAPPLELER